MNDSEQLIENMKTIKGYFLAHAIATRECDPRESFRMFKCSEACGKAAEELERMQPVETEIEGGGSTWWYVCGECHTTIDHVDRFCRQCGRPLKWDGKTSEEKQD